MEYGTVRACNPASHSIVASHPCNVGEEEKNRGKKKKGKLAKRDPRDGVAIINTMKMCTLELDASGTISRLRKILDSTREQFA